MSSELHQNANSATFTDAANSSVSRGQVRESQMGSWLKLSVIGLVVLTILGVVFTYFRSGSSAQPLSSKLTHKVARADLQVTVTEEGSLESSSNKEIKCRVRGGSTVLWIIKPGTQVKPGDELVRLDTKTIDDNINAQRIKYQNALALYAQSESDVAVAKINVQEFLEGTYRTDKQTLQKDIKVATSQLAASKDQAEYSRRMVRKGYFNQLQLEVDEEASEQKKMELDILDTKLDVLERYTKVKKIEELGGILRAKEAKMNSDKAALNLEKDRLDREEEQVKRCLIVAETSGMVIYPTTEQWKNQPNIEEGAVVREDQVLLVIPDLDQMQVKLGIHEAYVDRAKPGMPARVKLQDEFVDGEILSIASVTRPAGWWNGNQVKYETIVKLASQQGLKPGMSASVEVCLARHDNVLTVPVAAVVEQAGDFFCWVRTTDGTRRRRIDPGDSNDQFIVVNGGLMEGDDVVLNPRAYVKEAQIDALKPVKSDRGMEAKKPESAKSAQASPPAKVAKTSGL